MEMQAQPHTQHQWLHRLVGDWTWHGETSGAPGGATQSFSGTERVRAIGGLWVQSVGEGSMPGGGDATTVMTLGYDPAADAVVGTWIGSMMTHLWVYRGALDESADRLTLDTEGPSMSGEGTASYREVIEYISPDERTMASHVRADDGSWTCFMTLRYQRRAAPADEPA